MIEVNHRDTILIVAALGLFATAFAPAAGAASDAPLQDDLDAVTTDLCYEDDGALGYGLICLADLCEKLFGGCHCTCPPPRASF